MNIEKFCEIYNFGKVINVSKISGGLMHKMFKVETNKGIYCIKILNPEVMNRKEAHENFVISETVSNLAKTNKIPVSSAINLNGEYLKELDGYYYMVFDYINGKTLKDDEITIDHCRKIGNVLAHIHLLDYRKIGLEPNIVEYKRLYDWESYINNANFERMSYKDIFLKNYKKYNSILKRANERFNNSNINQTVCHCDSDPKHVMWSDNNPIVIDWECAKVANPERELLEDALCWSGFLSNKFDKEKFMAVFEEYFKYRKVNNIDWYDVICGNLVGRFGWLKYNLERSLGIISKDKEEMQLAENEVIKTIDEINRYLGLIGTMDELICSLNRKENNEDYTLVINEIIKENKILQGLPVKLINAGFTNTIYSIGNYIVRICSNRNNEGRFKNEIEFYKNNANNDEIPIMYVGDYTKSSIPYMYEILERVEGKTLYELWYKMNNDEKKTAIIKMINALKPFHLKKVDNINFIELLKSRINDLKCESTLPFDLFDLVSRIAENLFVNCNCGYIHGDLHFDNVIYDGTRLHILDFERSMIAPIDYEFRILAMCEYCPWKWANASTDMITVEEDYQGLIQMILDNYEELRNIPNINNRLKFYLFLELIDHYKNTEDKNVINEIYKRTNLLVKSINNIYKK